MVLIGNLKEALFRLSLVNTRAKFLVVERDGGSNFLFENLSLSPFQIFMCSRAFVGCYDDDVFVFTSVVGH
ncbi:MAG: hypothetical protein QXX99_05095 [Candidatus Bathyarchaeia archaeon]